MENKKKLQYFLIIIFLLLVGILVSEKINLVAADLGRHIKNGEELISNLASKGEAFRGGNLLKENFYSYTYSKYPFINHHWLSGVVFYIVHKYLGFTGLSIVFSLITAFTLGLFLDIGRRKSDFTVTFLCSLIFFPVILFRREIRPEVFSYLFTGIFWWILQSKKWSKHSLWVLPGLMLIWINLHVYFFWGFILMGLFWLEKLISYFKDKKKEDLKEIKRLTVVMLLSLVSCLINPAGIKGLLYPLNIFNSYGYRVLENQSVLFIDRVLGKYPANLYFKIGFGVLLVSWAVAFLKKKVEFVNLFLSLIISYLAWSAIRNFAIFGFFAIPIVCQNFSTALQESSLQRQQKIFLTSLAAVLIIFVFFVINPNYWLSKKIGWGLNKNVNASAQFFITNNLEGPIFNDYDIGGYLIYNLYPKEKVFVDNRPEAYPAEFFTETYVPMQENKDKWEEADRKYDFNAIFFYLNDITPWAQQFLTERVVDPNWAAVYADNYAIIFLKRNEKNRELIKKFELPKDIFSVKK